MNRYKDHYPTFWDYFFDREIKIRCVLRDARARGLQPFIKGFWKVYKWDVRLKGFRKATHDWFIGTRVL